MNLADMEVLSGDLSYWVAVPESAGVRLELRSDDKVVMYAVAEDTTRYPWYVFKDGRGDVSFQVIGAQMIEFRVQDKKQSICYKMSVAEFNGKDHLDYTPVHITTLEELESGMSVEERIRREVQKYGRAVQEPDDVDDDDYTFEGEEFDQYIEETMSVDEEVDQAYVEKQLDGDDAVGVENEDAGDLPEDGVKNADSESESHSRGASSPESA